MDQHPTLFDDTDAATEAQAWADGIRALEQGRFVSHEAVTRWLLSWGTEHELPRPKSGE